jgi:hypothetical protein
VCELHAESCELCDQIFCSPCFSRHLDKPHAKPSLPVTQVESTQVKSTHGKLKRQAG